MLAVLALRRVGSPDAGFHLATGRTILGGQGWPRTDSFTHTVAHHPYIDTSWGYDLLVAAVESVAGVRGLALVHALLALAAFAVVWRTARRVGADARTTLPLLLLGVLLSETRFEVRPELLSYAFLALVQDVLQGYASGRSRRLWPLFPIFLAWSNMHALFVVGWVVLGCFVLGDWIRRRRLDRRLLGFAVAAAGTALLNPYGLRGIGMSLVLATRLGGQHIFHEQIGEYETPFRTLATDQLGYYIVPITCLFVFAAIAVATLPRWWRARRFDWVALGIVFVPLAFTMVRNAPLLAIACLPGMAWAWPLERLLAAVRPGARLARRAERALVVAVSAVALFFGSYVATDAYYVGRGRLERFGWDWNPYRLPVDAAAWVRRTALEGRMLNDYDYGGYLVSAVPHKVFIDGRNEVMGEAFYASWVAAFTSPESLAATVERYDIGWTLFPYRRRPELLQRLLVDPAWRLAYHDHDAVVFVRANLAGTLPADPAASAPRLDLDSIPGLGDRPLPSPLGRVLAGFTTRQRYPLEPYALGVFAYLRGDWEGLAAFSAEAIRRSQGVHPELYGNLGSALWALGRDDAARRCLEIAVDATPWYRRQEKRNLRTVLSQVAAGGPGGHR